MDERTADTPPADGGPIVGIDLGTTNSLVAIADERGPRVLAPEGASPLVPSVVRYESDAAARGGLRAVVGEDAAERAVEFPATTVSSVKRLMGRGVADCAGDLPYLSYSIVAGEHDTARVHLPLGPADRVLTPQEISADILRALRARAEDALGVPVRRAVVTVPAYFDDAQRQATRDAGRLAGLEVVRIVNEPTAAALAYGLGLERGSERNLATRHVAVYDLGGGTFDVSILRITPAGEGGRSAYEVLATAGDTRLGGDDADHALVRLFLGEMGIPADRLGALPPETRRAIGRFARAVKHRLSTDESAGVQIATGDGTPYERTVTREEFESLIAPWADRTRAACERALRDAARELAGEPLDAVVLVGGSTRIPLVRRVAAEAFGAEPYTALDPDLVVALGAAVQGSILAGARTDALLLDVIPLSLGIETRGGAVAKLIPRNSAVPARATELFSTSVDGQVSVKLNILQGEREMAADCRSLGEFHLAGLPPMPAGVPQLEVEFLVDANGVLNVRAHERRSGKRASLQVIPNHGLTAEEVDRIEADSFAHAREDMQRHRVVDLVANSELDLKWIRERLERHEEDLPPGYAAELRGKASALRAMVALAEEDWASVDPDEFYRTKQALDEASVRLQEVAITASLRAEEARAERPRSAHQERD